ncbi:MAG: hypothetical protein A2Y54_04705 [Chloroflexi bacterium RBG_16_51_16]|nr:MAG: hypothetical protein A2Y54_04705 [Chloroflexi bacterium RBG_16_51_16]
MKSDLDNLMKTHHLEAILVLGDAENNPPMYYLTGGGHVSGAILIKKTGEGPVLYYKDMEREEAAKTGLTTRSMSNYLKEEYYKDAKGDQSLVEAMCLANILSEITLKGRVGIYGKVELSSALAKFNHLRRLAPEVEWVAESALDSVFLRAMETKDTYEVDRIRRMGKITTEVVGLVAAYLTDCKVSEGELLLNDDGTPLTIRDVKGKINLWLAERGAVLPEDVIFAIGRDAGIPHSVGNPEDVITLGKTIVFDIFPAEQGGGYYYDFTRTWCLGYAPKEAQELYDQVNEIYEKVRDNFDLNAPFSTYQKLTCEYFESKGHKSLLNTSAPLDGYVHTLGHGVGINIHERPFSRLAIGDDHRLVPGVVVTLEPGLYYPAKGMGVRIEDTYWFRPDGRIEILAEYPYDFVLEMKHWHKKTT